MKINKIIQNGTKVVIDVIERNSDKELCISMVSKIEKGKIKEKLGNN